MWTQALSLKLIEEVHCRRELWDVLSMDYRNRNKKADALRDIGEILSVSPEEIEKKLKNLKCQFRREYKDWCSKKKSGASPVQKPSWFAFDAMLFLLSSQECRGSRSTEGANERPNAEVIFKRLLPCSADSVQNFVQVRWSVERNYKPQQ